MRLRAAVDLAQLLRHTDPEAAYDLLLPVYSSFIEGFDTPDLVAAQMLLDDLKPSSASTVRKRA